MRRGAFSSIHLEFTCRVSTRARTSGRYLQLVRTFELEIGGPLTEADRVKIKQENPAISQTDGIF